MMPRPDPHLTVGIPGYGAFTSVMDKSENYLGVTAILQSGRTVSTVSESVEVDSCIGQKVYDVPFLHCGRDPPCRRRTGTAHRTWQNRATRRGPSRSRHRHPGVPQQAPGVPQQAPGVPQQAPGVPPGDPERTDPADDVTQPPPQTNGDGCGPGTVSRDGVCAVVLPDASSEAKDGGDDDGR